MGLTNYGLSLGFKEGNPLIVWLTDLTSMKFVSWAYFISAIMLTVGLNVGRNYFQKENHTRILYFCLALVIAWRVMVVTMWACQITYHLDPSILQP